MDFLLVWLQRGPMTNCATSSPFWCTSLQRSFFTLVIFIQLLSLSWRTLFYTSLAGALHQAVCMALVRRNYDIHLKLQEHWESGVWYFGGAGLKALVCLWWKLDLWLQGFALRPGPEHSMHTLQSCATQRKKLLERSLSSSSGGRWSSLSQTCFHVKICQDHSSWVLFSIAIIKKIPSRNIFYSELEFPKYFVPNPLQWMMPRGSVLNYKGIGILFETYRSSWKNPIDWHGIYYWHCHRECSEA